MENVGLNVRLITTLDDLIMHVKRLELTAFQSFLTFHETGNYITFSHDVYKRFIQHKKDIDLYIHGSYKINLASTLHSQNSCYFLKKELELANRLESGYLVIHPGSIEAGNTREQGIDAIAKKINHVLKKGNYPTLLLENVAFGNRSIGGEISELAVIRSKLDKPEKVKFCIDTAHAFSFGYNIADMNEQKRFIEFLEETLGIDSVALLHLNDSQEKLGLHRDRHAIPGEGLIGRDALKAFICDIRLKHIPCIVEVPNLSEDDLKKVVMDVRSWRANQ